MCLKPRIVPALRALPLATAAVVTASLVSATVVSVTVASAAGPRAPASSVPVHAALEAERQGLVEVRYIPNDSRSAQILIRNLADQPLTIQLPDAFVGVPVLAQMGMGGMGGMGGGMGGMGGGGGGGLGGMQATGGGMGGGMGGMGGGMGGMGGGMGGFCWVAREVYGPHDPRWVLFRDWLTTEGPVWLRELYAAHGAEFAVWIHDKPAAKWLVRRLMDTSLGARQAHAVAHYAIESDGSGFLVLPGRTRVVRFPTVCLEHGKAEPTPRVPYRLVELQTFSEDPRLAFVLKALADGRVTQKVAQAAAWHVANGLSWERLAAETIPHLVGIPAEPFFQRAELAAAMQLVAAAPASSAAEGTSTPGY